MDKFNFKSGLISYTPCSFRFFGHGRIWSSRVYVQTIARNIISCDFSGKIFVESVNYCNSRISHKLCIVYFSLDAFDASKSVLAVDGCCAGKGLYIMDQSHFRPVSLFRAAALNAPRKFMTQRRYTIYRSTNIYCKNAVHRTIITMYIYNTLYIYVYNSRGNRRRGGVARVLRLNV